MVLVGAMVPLSAGLEPAYDTVLYGLMALSLSVAGALIASRLPRNPIGWILLAMGVYSALVEVVEGFGQSAAAKGWAGGEYAEWFASWGWIVAATMWTAVFLLFPTGRLPGPRWRIAALVGLAGCALAVVGQALSADAGELFAAGRNPFALDSAVVEVAYAAGTTLLTVALLAAIASLLTRFRHAEGVERQQLKWFAYVACALAVVAPLSAAFYYDSALVRVLIAVVTVALPAAACVAILRYRLYDIDVVINRTLVYAALSVLLAAAFAATTLVLGTALGRDSAWAAAGATLAAAAAFRPLRTRVQDGVDRHFSRARYDGLRRIDAFLDALRAGRAAPEEVQQVLAEILDDPGLELRLLLPEGDTYVDLRGQEPAEALGDRRDLTPVRRAGATIGIVLHRPATDERPRLPAELVAAAGLAIEMARLRVELRRQLEAVDASRARIVSAGYEERRRIERDLHDGAQQRLVSIGLTLRHAQYELGGPVADDARRTLDEAVTEVGVAIEELRELARGVRPAQLDSGLLPALRELAHRVPVAVEVRAAPDRYPDVIEAAAYFIACEGVTNAVKHADASLVVLSVGRENGSLIVRVRDDGVGGALTTGGSGLGGLEDRVQAHGGSLRLESAAGHGTTLVAELPCVS